MGNPTSVKVAVVTGEHSFDVVNFHKLFRELDGIDAYIQHMDDWAASSGEVRGGYDVTLFYNFHMQTPPADGLSWHRGDPKSAIESLGEDGGILILHHALLAYPQWPLWNGIVGIEDRDFDYQAGESVRVEIADDAHPVTEGVKAWEMTDEVYAMAEPGEDSRVLATTDHPKSMKALAWTRRHKKARVFCFQSGHDNDTWADASFRKVLTRGILWCAGRI